MAVNSRTECRTARGPVFLKLADELNNALDKHFWACASTLVILFLIYAIAKDLWSKMWIDEFFTLHMSRQASLTEIVLATLERCDGAPPLYAMVVHAIAPWVQHDALATRLPATLGYCGMLLGLLAFCRRRLPAVYAFVAALLACHAGWFHSTDGRSYGIVLGLAAAALFCWQMAADGSRRALAVPLLAFCLTLMTAFHYYSIFFLIPLLLAEGVRWRISGKLDLAVLAAMTPVPVVLGLHYPLIVASKPFQEHFWSPALWSTIPVLYFRYFLQLCLLPLVLLAAFSKLPASRNAQQIGLTLPEWIAAGAFFLTPLCVVVLSRYTTHGFVERYTLWAIVGIALLVASLLHWAARGRTIIGAATLILLFAWLGLRSLSDLRKNSPLREAEAVHRGLASLPDGPEPIVVANAHIFMELSYYAAPQIRTRLIYPVSRDLELHYSGADTNSLLMSALGHRTKLPIIDYVAVLAAHPRFFLAAATTDYLPGHLVKAGFRLFPIGSSGASVFYEAIAP